MKLTGTNRPITYTTHHPANLFKRGLQYGVGKKKTRLLASTMWFPNNKPFVAGNRQLHNNTTPAPNGQEACCNHRFPTTTPTKAWTVREQGLRRS